MSQSREPRQWTKGDQEPPADVKLLTGRHFANNDLRYLHRCERGGWAWSYQDETDKQFGVSWDSVLSVARGPLIEVLPDPTPETWKPEPGDTVWTHFGEELTVVPVGPTQIRMDAFVLTENRHGQKFYFAPSDLSPVPPVSSVRGASISLSPSEDADTPVQAVSDELGAIRDFIVQQVGFDGGDVMTNQAMDLRDVLLAAGWRPPLPEGEANVSRLKPLDTRPGAVTRLTVNIGPRTAEALNAVVAEHDVTVTEALRSLVAGGYIAARQPARQVFFPGDTVPAGTPLMLDEGSLLEPDTVDEVWEQRDGPAVELLGVPSREEWNSIVARARAEREDNQ